LDQGSEPNIRAAALASRIMTTIVRLPRSWASALGTLQVATNCFFMALSWGTGKPTVAKTRYVSIAVSSVKMTAVFHSHKQSSGDKRY
jgi:hypothetical protein